MQFEAVHCWPDAPEAVVFLRAPHRHQFHVTAHKRVDHLDRAVEFIMLKWALQSAVLQWLETEDTLTWSCEHWAAALMQAFGLQRVEVSEDGENGAILEQD